MTDNFRSDPKSTPTIPVNKKNKKYLGQCRKKSLMTYGLEYSQVYDASISYTRIYILITKKGYALHIRKK